MIKRSECRCNCHTNPGIIHITACCTPDELELITKQEAMAMAVEAVSDAFRPNEHESNSRQELDLRITRKATQALKDKFK